MRVFDVVVIAIAGCSCARDPSSAPDLMPGGGGLEYELTIELATVTDRVQIDGVDAPIVMSAMGRVVNYSHQFDTYADGVSAPPIRIDFYAASTLQATGYSGVGVCQMNCIRGCPAPDSLTIEAVTVAEGSFTTSDFDCVQCETAEESVGTCSGE